MSDIFTPSGSPRYASKSRRSTFSELKMFGKKSTYEGSSQDYKATNKLSELIESHNDALQSLRMRFGDQISSDSVLYRFLQACEFNVEKSISRLELTLDWRRDHRFDEIVERYKDIDFEELPSFSEIGRFFPHS